MNKIEIQDLQRAKNLLENPGFIVKLTNYVGTPIEKGLEMLPKQWNSKLANFTQSALLKASHAAIFTMKDDQQKKESNLLHKISIAVIGGIGGFFGLPAMLLELPLSTTIMIRSIAEIARSNGETLSEFQTKLACLEVFALGGRNESDDNSESGYFFIRSMLAKSVTEASEFLIRNTIRDEGAPIIVKLISNISERFGIQLSEKAAAQSLPIIGALGGATINTIFIDHFQKMAEGHFIVRRLERLYGKDEIKIAYESLPILNNILERIVK